MVNNVRVVFADLDGTLILPDGTILPKIQAAIQKLKDNGIIVSCVTGRSFREVKMQINQLGIVAPSAFNGGAIIIDPVTTQTIEKICIDKKTASAVINEMIVYSEYISFGAGRLAARDAVAHVSVPEVLSIWLEVYPKNLEKVLSMSQKYESVVVCVNDVAAGELIGIQINNKLANKYHGALRLMSQVGAVASMTVAVGDDFNDMPLFEACAMSIAMGNAPAQLKSCANYVVADVRQGGFAEAVEKYILPA